MYPHFKQSALRRCKLPLTRYPATKALLLITLGHPAVQISISYIRHKATQGKPKYIQQEGNKELNALKELMLLLNQISTIEKFSHNWNITAFYSVLNLCFANMVPREIVETQKLHTTKYLGSFFSGNWQYWSNLPALPTIFLFCFRFHR
jgi:hypothetical protein